MKWDAFLKIAGDIPVINTQILLAGVAKPQSIEVQISRWKKSGKLVQIKRGVYLLKQAYRKIDVFEPALAAILKSPSYISLEKALEYHGLIPEGVAVYTSITTKRQAKFVSPAGVFAYKHVRSSLFWGYASVTVNRQTAFFASPEKALLDLFYLRKGVISLKYLEELRLQNLEKIDPGRLSEYALKFQTPGILKAAETLKKHIGYSRTGEKTL